MTNMNPDQVFLRQVHTMHGQGILLYTGRSDGAARPTKHKGVVLL